MDQSSAGEGDEEQRHHGADGEGEGDEDRLEVDVARRAEHRDRREHRSGARHEHQTQRQSDDETTTRTTRLATDQSGERPLQPFSYNRNHEPETDESQQHDARPHQGALGQVQPGQDLGTDEHEEAEAQDESEDDRHRSSPRRPRVVAWRRARRRPRRTRSAGPARCTARCRRSNRPRARRR